mmetsp:Transcript_34091/g.69741  ORF Transcript_34091/g.69741 Transcript_34091/m.69741 type:complete len:333 (+) Transcript_34091:631-1629(+)
MQGLLGGCQVLVREINAAIQGVHRLVRVAGDLRLGLLQIGLHCRDVMAHRSKDLVHLAASCVHIQAQGTHHVADRLYGSIQVVVGFLPCHIVHFGVQLGVHLILQVDDVFGQVLLLLLHLLQRVGHILHPAVVVLQGLLNVTDVQAHRGNLRRHCGLHPLTTGDDGVGGIHARPHLIEVNIHCIHGCRKVLHVTLASQDNATNMIHFALVVAQQIFQLAHVVLQLIQVLSHGVEPSSPTSAVYRFRRRSAAVHMGQFLVEVRLEIGELGCDLRFEVLESCCNLLHHLCIASSFAWSTCRFFFHGLLQSCQALLKFFHGCHLFQETGWFQGSN